MNSTSTTTGVLLVNLGTPDSPAPGDVYRYLIEFLTDPRVIVAPWIVRQLLVRGLIVPTRYRQSAKSYQEIWTSEGSPLKVYGHRVEGALQALLGDNFKVVLAMRYQTPSIAEGLKRIYDQRIGRLIVVPLFPQYASATTGSVHQRVMEEVSQWEVMPEMVFIDQFATHPGLIQAFSAAAQPYSFGEYDHILFSFHGLPKKMLEKADRSNCCFKTKQCCEKLTSKNQYCYSAQCYSTAHAIAKSLNLDPSLYSISFQSRLGKDPWLEPSTQDVIKNLALDGTKKLLVFCPSFVCDCLETLHEIGIEYGDLFKESGGDHLDLVPGLNDSPSWVSALGEIVRQSVLPISR